MSGVEMFPFSCACYFLLLCLHHTQDSARRSNERERRRESRADWPPHRIKENNKRVRGTWTSAVTQALTPRPRQFHQPKRCCLGFPPRVEQNQHLSWESEQWRWQVHRANDNTIAEMLGTTVPPTLLKGPCFQTAPTASAKPLKPLSCPYCPFQLG